MTTSAEAIGLPFEEAIDFFRQKIPQHSDHWADVWKEAHSRAFMVAGAASDSLLNDFHAALQKALSHGTTLAEFRRDFDRIVQTHGWQHTGTAGWRAQIIYETNLATAYSAGRYVQMTEPETLRQFPFWQYRHSGSRHPRLMHLAWDGMTLAADDPWWDTHYPPNGWHCGCRVSPVSRGGLRRMGKSGPDQAPPLVTRDWTNPKTGETHQVAVGVDPGFDYNMGKAWKQGRAAELPVRAPALRPVGGPLQQPTDKQIDALRQFIANPGEGVHPVGRVSELLRGALEGATDAVVHGDAIEEALRLGLTAEDLQLLPLLAGAPEMAAVTATGVLAAVPLGGAWLAGMLVAEADGVAGGTARITTLRQLAPETLARRMARGIRITGGGQ